MMKKSFFLILILLGTCGISPDGVTAQHAQNTENSLRSRILILDQALTRAARELGEKKQKKSVTPQDEAHYLTVNTYLHQQLHQACAELIESRGNLQGLPCSRDVQSVATKTPKRRTKHRQKPAVSSIPEHKTSKPITSKTQPLQEQHNQPVPWQKKEIASQQYPARKKPAGIFASIAQWLKALFIPHPPALPSPTASTSQEKASKTTPKKIAGMAAGKKTANENDQSSSLETAQGTTAAKEHDQHKQRHQNSSPSTSSKTHAKPYTNPKGNHTSNTPVQTTHHPRDTSAKKHVLKPSAAPKKKSPILTGQGKKKPPGKTQSHASSPRATSPQKKSPQVGSSATQHHSKPSIGSTKPENGTKPYKKKPRSSVNNGKNTTTRGNKQAKQAAINSLNRTLNTSLDEFDQVLLRENDRLTTRIPRQRATDAGMAAGRHEQEQEAATTTTNVPGGIASSGGRIQSGNGKTAIDNDDDIVARQLREAAEKESDKELQKKLWQEYRKYKSGQ